MRSDFLGAPDVGRYSRQVQRLGGGAKPNQQLQTGSAPWRLNNGAQVVHEQGNHQHRINAPKCCAIVARKGPLTSQSRLEKLADGGRQSRRRYQNGDPQIA